MPRLSRKSSWKNWKWTWDLKVRILVRNWTDVKNQRHQVKFLVWLLLSGFHKVSSFSLLWALRLLEAFVWAPRITVHLFHRWSPRHPTRIALLVIKPVLLFTAGGFQAFILLDFFVAMVAIHTLYKHLNWSRGFARCKEGNLKSLNFTHAFQDAGNVYYLGTCRGPHHSFWDSSTSACPLLRRQFEPCCCQTARSGSLSTIESHLWVEKTWKALGP